MEIAILGMGSIGRRHARNLIALGHRPLAYDTDLDACGVAPGQQAEWDTALSLKGVWAAKPDAVLICTPPGSHLELAIEAYRHGCHAFIEKPLGCHERYGFEPWAEIAEKFEHKGLVNMVACNWRYHEGVVKLRAAVDSGVIVRPWRFTAWHYSYLPNWRPGVEWRKHYSASKEQGGVTMEVAWHLVDLALWLFGPARLVDAEIKPATALGLECDGLTGLELRHKNGVKSIIEADFQYRRNSWAFIVESTVDRISWDAKRSKGYDINRMYYRQLADFLECVEFGTQAENPISNAVKVLELLLEAKEKGK